MNKLLRKAQGLFIKGKHKESINIFTKCIEAGGEREIALLSRGVAYLKAGKTDKAAEDFTQVIAMNSRNVRAYYYRGITYMIKENYQKAIRDLEMTIKLKPDHGGAFFALGTAYSQIGNEYEAAINIKTAIKYSEATLQDFAEHYGMFRTQFDRTIAFMTNEAESPALVLTDEEIKILKKWLEEDNKYH